MDNRVSVIIPCYNVEEYVFECVQSVLRQTFTNIEIICIDNNSTDNTWQILSDLALKDSRIVIAREYRAGANAARNRGLKIAKGSWIQFLDADDLLAANKLEHQLNLIQNCGTNISFIAAMSTGLKLDGSRIDAPIINTNRFIAAFVNQCGNTCSNLWRKDKILEIGGWDEELKSSQEADLMFRVILSGGEYLADNMALTVIRERATGQISQSNPVARWACYIDVHLNYMNSLKGKYTAEYEKYRNYFLDALMVSILILGTYDNIKASGYFGKHYRNWKSEFKFGLTPTKVVIIKSVGLSRFLIMRNLWTGILRGRKLIGLKK